MKRVALYVRVSTDEQKKHGLSVDNQIYALNEYCKEKGYTVAGLYNDAGISARKKYTNRPALLQLIEDVKDNKVDIIIFTKLDRWFRSVADYYQVQTILDEYKVPWRAIWEDYETETSAGVFKVNIMLSVAQSEADRTSERIKATLDYKMSKGDYIGSIPYGYKRINGKLEIDEEKRACVEEMFDTMLSTYQTKSVLDVAIKHGWSPTVVTIRRLLTNPVYSGITKNGICPAFVTKEEQDRIANIFKNHTTSRERKRDYIFSGLLICSECGGLLRATATTKKGIIYKGYVCAGIQSNKKHSKYTNISERKLESYMLSRIDELVSDYNIKAKTTSTSQSEEEYFKAKRNINAKLERIGIRFENGDISTEEYLIKTNKLKEELTNMKHPQKLDPIELPIYWQDIYAQLDVKHKAKFWKKILRNIEISNSGDDLPKVIFL